MNHQTVCVLVKTIP